MKKISKVWCLLLAAGVLALLPTMAAAQVSVVLGNNSITVNDSAGVPAGTWSGGGDDLFLGLLGVGDGDLNLRRGIAGNPIVLNLDGTSADGFFGGNGVDGDLFLRNTAGATTLSLDGNSGNANQGLGSNGFVKAWARINSSGTVNSCYNCSTSGANTQKISTGTYEVDFTISSNISGRPVLCTNGTLAVFGADTQILCVQRSGDPSSVFVITRTPNGTISDDAFTVVVF